jgi:hypothetical protein
MPETASQKRIEKKNLKKLSKEPEVVPSEAIEPKKEKTKENYCVTCRSFQKHPVGYCKILKEYRPRKAKACEKHTK